MKLNGKIVTVIILFMLSPILIKYFSSLDVVALWLYAWMPGFAAILLFEKTDLFIRGLFFITWTIILTSIGVDNLAIKYPDNATALVMLSNMLNIIAAGIGGNFMAHDIISKQKSKA